MEENGYQLLQHELEANEVMKVRREVGVYPSSYPCLEFMGATGILQDFRTLISNAGLENFLDDEPYQYAKLTMGVVQDFSCDLSSSNPMVHYRIYNKTVNLPFGYFCAAIRVPQWGSLKKIKERPEPLMELYKEICNGRSFTDEDGKIRSIHFPCIRYFAHFISKCVLARKTASKMSSHDLAFLSAALKLDRTYNLGALIAYRFATNREKGEICGGLIASRLLAFHGVEPHHSDIRFPIERLDFASMKQHKFISSHANLKRLSFELTFVRTTRWKTTRSERTINLPAPLLFNLNNRGGWSLTENELDAYIEEHPQQVEGDEEEAGAQPHQQPAYDYEPSTSSTSQAPNVGDGSGWDFSSPWKR